MSSPFRFLERVKAWLGLASDVSTRELTRQDFYELSAYLRKYSQELATYDQNRVYLKQCYRFNAWLPSVKSYDRLQQSLATMKPARPVSRWQVIVLVVLVSFIVILAVGGHVGESMGELITYGLLMTILVITFFIPERFYGTTMELLEGKVLRIVDALEELHQSEELGFSEAVYFRIREDLKAAKRELRQQIDLAHRN